MKKEVIAGIIIAVFLVALVVAVMLTYRPFAKKEAVSEKENDLEKPKPFNAEIPKGEPLRSECSVSEGTVAVSCCTEDNVFKICAPEKKVGNEMSILLNLKELSKQVPEAGEACIQSYLQIADEQMPTELCLTKDEMLDIGTMLFTGRIADVKVMEATASGETIWRYE